jgi:hypothetical protein
MPSPRRVMPGMPPAAPPPRGRQRSQSPAPRVIAVPVPVHIRSPSPGRPPSPLNSPVVTSPWRDAAEPNDRHTPPRPAPQSSNSDVRPFLARPPSAPPLEAAVRWDYDFVHNKWSSSNMNVRVERVPFQKGSMRLAYHMLDDKGAHFVAKCRIKAPPSNKGYFEDAAMQAACQHYAMAYNRRGPPKAVSFIDSFVLQLTDREGRQFMACEEYLPGVYAKYNNNGGWLSEDARNTPQAFSHFTYGYSQRKLIIVDIQGVGDRYTDPQLHSLKQRYGAGDLGVVGMQLFFQTHQCNGICRGLGLTDASVDANGTQMK